MARTQTVTILFCDLVASTERRAHLGDDAFDEFSARFLAALRNAVSEHNGREVSNAGDGLMIVFPESVADAVACAIAMHRAVAQLDPRDPPQLRIGISSGEVAQDGDGFSGMPIVEAARLEASAAPGQTLANAVVRALVGTRRALRFRDVGALTLKGIPSPLAAVEVIDEEVVDEPRPARPVPPIDAPPPTRRRRGPIVAVAATLVVALVIAAVVATRPSSHARASSHSVPAPLGVPAPKGYTPRYTTTRCPADVRAVAADASCGHLVVPQDRRKPHGKQVSLLVTRAPPRLSGPSADPTIDICGCENLGNSLARDHSELIHVGQRGYEGSDPMLTCPEFVFARLQARSVPSNDPAAMTRATDALRRCYANLAARGIDPAQYNYDTAAQDVLDLVFVLKIRRANFVAFEEAGAELFDVLRRAPSLFRTMTLDNPPPPGQTILSDPIGDLSGAFGRFVAFCNADPTCTRGYGDLAAKWRAAYAASSSNPSLQTVTDPNASNAPRARVLLDGPRIADVLGIALADASQYRLIPAGITSPASAGLVATALVQNEPLFPNAPWGAQASYVCAYDVHTENPQGLALEGRTLPEFVQASNADWVQWCNVWKVPDVSATLSANVVSDVPTLVFRGNLSPDGNPDWIPRIERSLTDVRAVIFPTLGSDLLANGPPCLSALRRSFLANPAAKLPIAACEKLSPPIPFVAPSP